MDQSIVERGEGGVNKMSSSKTRIDNILIGQISDTKNYRIKYIWVKKKIEI